MKSVSSDKSEEEAKLLAATLWNRHKPPKPPRELTPEEIQQRIDDNFFDEEYD